jgi:ABC-type Zn uptake system ZnuABC Zn-binding protein ZnuA
MIQLEKKERAMIDHLRQVIERVEQLDPDDQATIAAQLQRYLEELEAERGWRERFSDPRALEAIDQMAEEAHQEFLAGETVDLDEVLRAI